MCQGWKPVEITCSGSFASGQDVTFTVVLEHAVVGPQNVEVAISTNNVDAFDYLPESAEVPPGTDQVTFPARFSTKPVPEDLWVSASSDGGTVYYPSQL